MIGNAQKNAAPASTGDRSRAVLDGIRVLDIGTMVAGPVAATLLAEFGADVIKIEKPEGGDSTRAVGPFCEGGSLWWQVEGHNKKSVTLDLRRKRGQEILLDLASKCDVLIENFRPGTLERWGIGPQEMQAVNPGLIICRVSGFGQTGPYRERAGYDRIGQAFGGLMHITGYPDRAPIRPGTAIADYQSALFAAFGTLLALYARDTDRTGGKGQEIDLALYESIFRFTDIMVPAFDKFGLVRQRQGNLHFAAAPGEHFRMKDDRYLVMTCSSDGVFARICKAMGRPEMAQDERFRNHEGRWKHITELNAMIADWVAATDAAELLPALDQAGAPYTVALTIADIFADPQYAARENIVSVPHPAMGEVKMPGVVPKLSLTPGAITSPGPSLGQHTDEVLRNMLGLSDADLAALRENGII